MCVGAARVSPFRITGVGLSAQTTRRAIAERTRSMNRLAVLALALLPTAALSARADPLEGLTIASEVDAPYNRNAMYGRWRDADNDCQKTRDEVLAIESLIPVTMNNAGCKVTAGLWFDPFTSLMFMDPGDVDIDHLVPLKEAHQSGAHAWDNDKRRRYTNDLDNPGHLIAVDDGTDQSKGFKGRMC